MQCKKYGNHNKYKQFKEFIKNQYIYWLINHHTKNKSLLDLDVNKKKFTY